MILNKENSDMKKSKFVLNDMVKEKILSMYKISENDVKKSGNVQENASKNISQ